MADQKNQGSSRKKIRIGIGGWSYAPWRKTFYPEDVPQARALIYASRQFSAIEVNSTFYASQKPATFARWHDETPDDFVFTVKAPRVATHRRDLSASRDSIDRFVGSGIDRLGEKLGPLLWQFPATRRFDEDAFGPFLESLPKRLAGRPLQHALDVRHESFSDVRFVALARQHQVAITYTDATDAPSIADPTCPFVYVRLREAKEKIVTGYSPAALKKWAAAAQAWSAGALPARMKAVGSTPDLERRDVYVFFINGAKERAPAAARKLIDLL